MSGEKIWEYSTDRSILNTKHKNIISHSGNNLVLLNTNGSVYAIDILNKNIKWFYNVNSIVASKNDIFNHDKAEGFIYMWGMSNKIWAELNSKNK